MNYKSINPDPNKNIYLDTFDPENRSTHPELRIYEHLQLTPEQYQSIKTAMFGLVSDAIRENYKRFTGFDDFPNGYDEEVEQFRKSEEYQSYQKQMENYRNLIENYDSLEIDDAEVERAYDKTFGDRANSTFSIDDMEKYLSELVRAEVYAFLSALGKDVESMKEDIKKEYKHNSRGLEKFSDFINVHYDINKLLIEKLYRREEQRERKQAKQEQLNKQEKV